MAPFGSAGVRLGSLRPCQLAPRMGAPDAESPPLEWRSTTGPPAPAWFAGLRLGPPCILMDGTVPGRCPEAVVPAPATVAEPRRPRGSRADPRAKNARFLT